MEKSPFERTTIIGLGLIGSSIARACREHRLASVIVGCDHNEVSMAYGHKHSFIDAAIPDPADAVSGSNLVILATPPMTLSDMAKAIAPALKDGAMVMDVCSVKQPAMEAIMPHLPPSIDYMPAHPIAGSEQSGIRAGRADLFERKRVILTPSELNQDHALQKATHFWQSMGARVEGMPAHIHDIIYAYVSHLPHLLAFAAAQTLADDNADEDNKLISQFLRLSGSNPTLWAEIFTLNKANMLKAVDRYLDAVTHIRDELAQAPSTEPDKNDDALAYHLLFARIAASCLVTTVMEAEKQSGFSFARYAGEGFADFSSPASRPPDEDIERISSRYRQVDAILGKYAAKLKRMRSALESGNLKKALTKA